MGVGEQHSLFGQAIDVGRGHLRFRVVTGHIAVAEIVREDENNVRLGQVMVCDGGAWPSAEADEHRGQANEFLVKQFHVGGAEPRLSRPRREVENGEHLTPGLGLAVFLRLVVVMRRLNFHVLLVAAFALGQALGQAQPVVPGLLHERHGLDAEGQGRVLIEELRCAWCHKGPVKRKLGPNLSAVGARMDAGYLKRFTGSAHDRFRHANAGYPRDGSGG